MSRPLPTATDCGRREQTGVLTPRGNAGSRAVWKQLLPLFHSRMSQTLSWPFPSFVWKSAGLLVPASPDSGVTYPLRLAVLCRQAQSINVIFFFPESQLDCSYWEPDCAVTCHLGRSLSLSPWAAGQSRDQIGLFSSSAPGPSRFFHSEHRAGV